MFNCSAVLEPLPVASTAFLNAGAAGFLPRGGAAPGWLQGKTSLLLGTCCRGGWDTIHLLAIGLSSSLYQLGSWGSQLVLAAAPEAGLWLGEIQSEGLGRGWVVASAPRRTPGSFPVLSDLMLDSGINKQSHDGRSCQNLLMPLQNQSPHPGLSWCMTPS